MKQPLRHLTHLLLVAICVCWANAATTTTSATSTIEKDDEWKLLWSDDFNSDDNTLNPSYWNKVTGFLGFNAEFQTYTDNPKNLYVRDGKLHIAAIRDFTAQVGYTSGRINTLDNIMVKYGMIEASIKIPNMLKGLWPAFWTLGENYPEVGWPASGELDILEAGQKLGSSQGKGNHRIVQAFHWDAYGEYVVEDAHIDMPYDLSQQFVSYKMIWQPDAIETYVDNYLVYRIRIDYCEHLWDCSEFHQFHYLILNMAVAGLFTCCEYGFELNDYPNGTSWVMEVDWVKVWGNQHTEIIMSPQAQQSYYFQKEDANNNSNNNTTLVTNSTNPTTTTTTTTTSTIAPTTVVTAGNTDQPTAAPVASSGGPTPTMQPQTLGLDEDEVATSTVVPTSNGPSATLGAQPSAATTTTMSPTAALLSTTLPSSNIEDILTTTKTTVSPTASDSSSSETTNTPTIATTTPRPAATLTPLQQEIIEQATSKPATSAYDNMAITTSAPTISYDVSNNPTTTTTTSTPTTLPDDTTPSPSSSPSFVAPETIAPTMTPPSSPPSSTVPEAIAPTMAPSDDALSVLQDILLDDNAGSTATDAPSSQQSDSGTTTIDESHGDTVNDPITTLSPSESPSRTPLFSGSNVVVVDVLRNPDGSSPQEEENDDGGGPTTEENGGRDDFGSNPDVQGVQSSAPVILQHWSSVLRSALLPCLVVMMTIC